jgi:hypothetical protein
LPLAGQRSLAVGRELVDAPATAAHVLPVAHQQAVVLQAMQRWVDRALGQVEGPSGAVTEIADHGVAMPGPIAQHAEQQQVQVALGQIGLHT